jgi:hypothetical protein
MFPRQDALYAVLGLYLISIPIHPTNAEWYVMASKRYRDLLHSRLVSAAATLVLTFAWLESDGLNIFFLPVIFFLSSLAGSAWLARILDRGQLAAGFRSLRKATPRGIGTAFLRQLPVASSLLVAPYFLAYALPWYSIAVSDDDKVGAFSVAYRLVIGLSALVSPMVYFVIPRMQGGSTSFRKAFGLSSVASLAFWGAGSGILWLYFRLSGTDFGLFGFSLKNFSILMIGFFFLCMRTPYVGRCLAAGRYREYFLLVVASCLPVILLSTLSRGSVPAGAIVWLACLPDIFATLGFIAFGSFGTRFSRAEDSRRDLSA